MAHASAVLPLFSAGDFAPLRDALRAGSRVLAGAVQAVGFAGVMWLVLAGPGFLTDRASTAPTHFAARR